MARARLSLRGQFVERDDHRREREREGEQRWWSVVAKSGERMVMWGAGR